jgi:hypothetical protein
MGDERSDGSNAGVVIVIVLGVLAFFCCGGVAFLGFGVFSFQAAPMQKVQIAPPMVQDQAMEAPELESEPLPEQPAKPDPSFKDLLPNDDSFKDLVPKSDAASDSPE